MRIEIDVMKEVGKRDFSVGVVSFETKTSRFDHFVVHKALNKARDLAARLNPHAANNSADRRTFDLILAHALMGVLSECAWKHFINVTAMDVLAKETVMEDASNQIDLLLSDERTVEIRSSCVSNGIRFGVYGGYDGRFAFDVIGPYHNGVKPGERLKDFFLRSLFHFNSNNVAGFVHEALDATRTFPLNVYLVGGATRAMMENKDLFRIKELAEHEITGGGNNHNGGSHYRVIPLPSALDVTQVTSALLAAR